MIWIGNLKKAINTKVDSYYLSFNTSEVYLQRSVDSSEAAELISIYDVILDAPSKVHEVCRVTRHADDQVLVVLGMLLGIQQLFLAHDIELHMHPAGIKIPFNQVHKFSLFFW